MLWLGICSLEKFLCVCVCIVHLHYSLHFMLANRIITLASFFRMEVWKEMTMALWFSMLANRVKSFLWFGCISQHTHNEISSHMMWINDTHMQCNHFTHINNTFIICVYGTRYSCYLQWNVQFNVIRKKLSLVNAIHRIMIWTRIKRLSW